MNSDGPAETGSAAPSNLLVDAVPDPKVASDNALADYRQRRELRAYAFWFLITSSSVVLAALIVTPVILILCYGPSTFLIPIMPANLTLIGIGIGVFAGIGLSLAMAILRLVEDPKPTTEKNEKSITTPIYELVKAVVTGISDAIDLIKKRGT